MSIPDKATYVYAGLHALLITAISLAHSITRHVTTSIVHLEKRQYDTEQKNFFTFCPNHNLSLPPNTSQSFKVKNPVSLVFEFDH